MNDFTEALQTFARCLLAVGRLSACVSIGEAEPSNKLRSSEEASAYIDATDALLATLNDYADSRDGFEVAWPASLASSDRDGTRELTSAKADSMRVDLSATTRAIGGSILGDLRQTPLLAYTRRQLERALVLLPHDTKLEDSPTPTGHAFHKAQPRNDSRSSPIRRLSGPRDSPLSSMVERGDSIADRPAPVYTDRLEDAIPYMWNLSTREGMASDLCSLSIVEYDGLPLRFYRDFAKQAVDEASHSLFFMTMACELMNECQRCLPSEHPVRLTIEGFRRGERKLPVAREGNLYEAIWAANLTERLVIMHHDTEAPAVKRLAARLDDSLCSSHPAVKNGFAIDRYDEASHAAIGARWLRHLYPDTHARRKAIADARRVRGLLLLGAIARYGDRPLQDLIADYGRPLASV